MINLKDFNVANFPDGHKHIVSQFSLDEIGNSICVSIRSFDDLFLLAQVKDIHPQISNLRINYLLGARCDRRFSKAEALDLEIVCDFINNLNFEKIEVLKPHSSFSLELLNNSKEVDITRQLIDNCLLENSLTGVCFVSPDKGASQWIHKFDLKPLIQCEKVRENGSITVKLPPITPGDSWLNYSNFVIIDDLCDGGGTFTAIAKEIKLTSPLANVYLVVTHAILSKGFQPFEGLIKHIYCTDSFAKFEHPLVKQVIL